MTDGDGASALPTVSVIICCRNSASTLAETLDAIASQHYPGWWEVLVVDNGSTDHTAALARGYEGRLPNLRVLGVPRPGHQARALNHGISESKGDCFVFVDSDDVVGDDYVLHMARALATQPFVGAAMDVQLLNPPQVRERRDLLQEQQIDEFCGFLPAVVGAAMGARREPLDSVGGFDESLPTQHDLDISWRLSAAGYQASFVPDATVHYRYRTDARAIFRQEFGYGDGEVVLFRKFAGQGMPRRNLPRVVVGYARLMLALAGARRPGGAERFATILGMTLGRLRGSLRYRTLYL